MKYLKQFALGILAGLAIGLGSFLFILLKTYLNGELGKVVSSLIFAVGLFIVCSLKLSLFTGKIGLIFEKLQTKDFYISLPIMLLGNAVGAVGLGYLCFAIFKTTDLFQTVTSVSNLRLVDLSTYKFDNFLVTALKGLACGLCVYLAVKSFALSKNKIVGTLLLIFFVFFFVYFGFEHCIANMFYFSMANLWTGSAFVDLVIVIAFNSIGTIPGVFLLKAVDPNG